MNDTSLKDYYTRLNTLYENCINILTALNQSLSTYNSEVTLTIADTDDATTTVRLPSFLYLENKVELLDLNFGTLFNMPKSGEAWFNNDNNLYKLEMVLANTAPSVLTFADAVSDMQASITDNNILKDLVSPKTFLKVNIDDLPNNVDRIFMKKYVFYNTTLFENLKNANISPTTDASSYELYKAIFYNYTKGVDYDEYESLIDLPTKKSKWASSFLLKSLPTDSNEENPWVESNKYRYELELDTIQYHDSDDSSIVYTLKKGDRIYLTDSMTIYDVIQVNISKNYIVIEESVGHRLLSEADIDRTTFEIYDTDYSDFSYIQVPLEENQYIAVFLASVVDNVRSLFSEPILIDLDTVYMVDLNGQYIMDDDLKLSYMQYYNKYCTNIGDLILGLTLTTYPLISNFTVTLLDELQNGDSVKEAVDETFDTEEMILVVPINKHLIDDTTNEDIINLHTQKNDLNSLLESVQANIDSTYNTLITTDFSQTTSITQLDLQSKLQGYYTERTNLTKQIIQVVNNINTKALDSYITDKTKYRIRGITSVDALTSVVQGVANDKVEIIGIDVEYKYKSVTKDTTNVSVIDKNTFTDWNKLNNIDRQRLTSLNLSTNSYGIKFEDYGTTDNKVKWNLIDIPIQLGEDVIMRLRYKYNIGQPFINLYTPWSEETTIVFPDQYTEDLEVVDILNENADDSIQAKFDNTLINDGYTEHVTNKLLSGNLTFFHLPENIYSGFNTAENNLISLKDKLQSMSNTISNLEEEVDNVLKSKYSVYLSYDENMIELMPNLINTITLSDNGNISTSYTKKKMNIVIKNMGETSVNFYSLFPGNLNIRLLQSNNSYYNKFIAPYQSVPIFINDSIDILTLGQWIYFRSTNAFTSESIYYLNKYEGWSISPTTYMRSNYNQPAFMYRPRTSYDIDDALKNLWNIIMKDRSTDETPVVSKYTSSDSVNVVDWDDVTLDDMMYKSNTINFINRFEEIYYIDSELTNSPKVYLDENSNLQDFALSFKTNYKAENSLNSIFSDINNYNGAFIYPNVTNRSLITTDGELNGHKTIEVGESVSIPFEFEYFINGNVEGFDEVTKGLYFDLRNSLFTEPKHYILHITAKHNNTFSNYNYTNILDVLQDDATDSE